MSDSDSKPTPVDIMEALKQSLACARKDAPGVAPDDALKPEENAKQAAKRERLRERMFEAWRRATAPPRDPDRWKKSRIWIAFKYWLTGLTALLFLVGALSFPVKWVYSLFGHEHEGTVKFEDCRSTITVKPTSWEAFWKDFTCTTSEYGKFCIHVDLSSTGVCEMAYTYLVPAPAKPAAPSNP